MGKFLDFAKKVAGVVSAVTGFVAALSAGMVAFRDELHKHYNIPVTAVTDNKPTVNE